MISRKAARGLAKSCSKHSHLLLASALMKRLAQKLGENIIEWEIVGLLHDLDFDQVQSNMSKHGVVAAERLKGRLPEHCLRAIRSHDYRTEYQPRSKLDHALIAVDSLAMLTQTIAEESKEPTIQNLRQKLDELSLEKPWHRTNIHKCKELGLSIDELLGLSSILRKKGGKTGDISKS